MIIHPQQPRDDEQIAIDAKKAQEAKAEKVIVATFLTAAVVFLGWALSGGKMPWDQETPPQAAAPSSVSTPNVDAAKRASTQEEGQREAATGQDHNHTGKAKKMTTAQMKEVAQETDFRVSSEILKFDKNKDYVIDGRDWNRLTLEEKRECSFYMVNGWYYMLHKVEGVADPDDDAYNEKLHFASDAALPALDGYYSDRHKLKDAAIQVTWNLETEINKAVMSR